LESCIKGMNNLLVLGAGGFIAKRFIEMFGDRHAIVPVVSDRDGKNPDLSNFGELLPIVDEFKPAAILNLAGKSYHSTGEDAGIYESNALVQLNIHEAAKRLNLKPKVIVCSSSAVYESSAGPVDEDSTCLPVNSYAKSKYLQERIALSYSPGQDVVIARLFNVIGPFQNRNFFIPTLIDRVLSYKKKETSEVILKTLNAMRDFIYIDDVCSAINVLIENGESGEAYNVCSGEGVSIEKVIETIKRILGISELPINTKENHVKNGIDYQVGSNKKIEELGWSPEYDIEKSLEEIIKEEHGC
jgi:GDP-4-dehydro-6-deoxy-D-mannose reductase